jgi:serine/threonine protein phosphatase PrpC
MNEQHTAVFAAMQTAPELANLKCGSIAMFSTRSPAKKTINEDAYAVVPIDEETIVLAVADGVGGHPFGDAAARLAIQSLIVELRQRTSSPLDTAILSGFAVGQGMIIGQIPGAATTLVVVEISKHTARTYNVGDSGVCVIGSRGKNKLQTVFQSPTGYAVAAGLLTESEAMRHAGRHLVSNIMGSETMEVDVGKPMMLALRDTVVIASDGLYDNLMSAEIAELACRGTIDEACRSLVDTATQRMHRCGTGQPSKPDDLTVLLYRQHRKPS